MTIDGIDPLPPDRLGQKKPTTSGHSKFLPTGNTTEAVTINNIMADADMALPLWHY